MEGFKARDIGLRAQKKILSRMATKNIAKVFIDDTSANILDNVYKLAKTYVSIRVFFFRCCELFQANYFSCRLEIRRKRKN